MAVLKIQGYQGSLSDLASHLRRRRIDALTISARELVEQLREAWQPVDIPSFDEVADELPVAAWVVRRKGQSLIPGSVEEEGEEPPAAAPWAALVELVGVLMDRYPAAYARYGPPRWPSPPPPEIHDATPWRLRWAWPPGRPAPRRPAPEVVLPGEPLWRRGLLVAHWLRRQRGQGRYAELAESLAPDEQVDLFLIVLALWARRRLSLDQREAYGPLTIRLRRRVAAGGDPA